MDNFKNLFEGRYKQKKSLFGDEPMPLVKKALGYIDDDHVLDLGVGDGRNALYLLKNGFQVTGVDMSSEGLKNLQEKTQKYREHLEVIESNVLDLKLAEEFDMILGIGLLHFLKYSDIEKLIKWVKRHTKLGGLNVFAAKMFQNPMRNLPFVFGKGDLKKFYIDPEWEILHYEEKGISSIIAKKLIENKTN